MVTLCWELTFRVDLRHFAIKGGKYKVQGFIRKWKDGSWHVIDAQDTRGGDKREYAQSVIKRMEKAHGKLALV